VSTPLPRIVVAVCTYRRNDGLAALLGALATAAEKVTDRAAVGVVVVDDNPDGAAAAVADAYDDAFALGVRYEHSGKRNISVARNLGLETAAAVADWVGLTDDDCIPVPEWFEAHLDNLAATGTTASTGPLVPTVPEGTPRWVTDQPFLQLGQFDFSEHQRLDIAATNNSLVSAAWLRDHPATRFSDELGRVGGEDMVFFRRAHRAGLEISYALGARVYEPQPPARLTFGYQLRRAYWLGNSEAVTNLTTRDVTRGRLLLRAGNRVRRTMQRCVVGLVTRGKPELRYTLAASLGGVGMALGAVGVRVEHR
jgi:succinoglycan biosynthesis protein ExoM